MAAAFVHTFLHAKHCVKCLVRITVGRMTSSKDVRVLIPKTYTYATPHGKRGFGDVIKPKILRCDIFWVVQVSSI